MVSLRWGRMVKRLIEVALRARSAYGRIIWPCGRVCALYLFCRVSTSSARLWIGFVDNVTRSYVVRLCWGADIYIDAVL